MTKIGIKGSQNKNANKVFEILVKIRLMVCTILTIVFGVAASAFIGVLPLSYGYATLALIFSTTTIFAISLGVYTNAIKGMPEILKLKKAIFELLDRKVDINDYDVLINDIQVDLDNINDVNINRIISEARNPLFKEQIQQSLKAENYRYLDEERQKRDKPKPISTHRNQSVNDQVKQTWHNHEYPENIEQKRISFK